MSPVKTDTLLQTGIAVLLAAFSFVLYDAIHENLVNVGDRAPDFSVTSDLGRKVTPRDFGGKLLVLNFWATWCPPCVEEMPSLDQFARRSAGSGIVVLGVSVDKDEKQYRRFLDRAKVGFQTARDPENKINAEYGTFKFPETYVINAEGRVVRKIIGPQDWTDERFVNDLKGLL